MLTPSTLKNPLTQRGMSLIELMIAMTLGIFIVIGITTLFVQNKQSYRQDEMLTRMQEDARFALNSIVDDIESAGFWAGSMQMLMTHGDVAIGGTSCNGAITWVADTDNPVVAYEHSSGSITTAFGCIASSSHQPNSDAIALNRVTGFGVRQEEIDAGTATLNNNTLYLRSNGASGILLKPSMDGSIVSGAPEEISYWQYTPRLYYVRNHANAEGDGIPTLCRFEMDYSSSTPQMNEQCLASGVESLQIEYGIDTTTDGTANRYLSTPSANQVRERLVSVRVHLLMRSAQPDPGYTNSKTYSIGNLVNYAPNDNYYRRVYTTTVLVRNTRNLRCLNMGC